MRTGTAGGDITFSVTEYRLNDLVIAFLIISDKVSPIPFLFELYDFRELIDLKLLVLRRV